MRRALGIVCCDSSVAFDTVSHRILIDKMKKYGLAERGRGVKTGRKVGPRGW